jgi:ArsR family transcriptional regulator
MDCRIPDLPSVLKGEGAEALAAMCKALGHPARVRILQILIEKDSCIAGDLAGEFELAQSTVSEHLRLLKGAGLIQGTIEGQRRCYCVNPVALKLLKNLVKSL